MLLDSSKLFSDSSSAVIQLSQEQLEKALLWSCQGGCGSGSHELSASRNITTEEEIYVSEMKFFFCGPSNENLSVNSHQNDLSILRSFCLLIETNTGDLHLYTGSKPKGINQLGFRRVPLRTITRRSKEENRHRNKLIRKGIVVDTDDVDDYRPSKFYRFFSLSGQDGLFSATTRPLWFVSERGAPTALSHRLRHSAPSGSSFLSVSGFCSGLQLNEENSSDIGFITVHERIGQVGSQRLTFFNG
jgi:cleavage and polyadenylation specificity factor subunit 1